MGGLVDWWIGGLVDWRLVDWSLVYRRLVVWWIGGLVIGVNWVNGGLEGA